MFYFEIESVSVNYHAATPTSVCDIIHVLQNYNRYSYTIVGWINKGNDIYLQLNTTNIYREVITKQLKY